MVNVGDLGWEDLLEEGMATHYTTEQLTTAHIYIYIHLWEKSENKGRKIPKLENVLTPFFYKV